MRIISSFKDYYDQHDYAENDDVYIRETKEIIKDDEPIRRTRNRVVLEKLVIGFCGEMYPIIKIIVYNDNGDSKIRFFHTKEDFKKYDKHDKDDFIQYGSVYPSGGGAIAFFDKDFSSHKKDFIEHGVPYFVKKIDEYRDEASMFILNPVLINYKFGRVKDAQTAFQEIDMYISGVLGNKEVMIEIEDKYRVAAHGYNEESFRMPAGRKKPRRKGK